MTTNAWCNRARRLAVRYCRVRVDAVNWQITKSNSFSWNIPHCFGNLHSLPARMCADCCNIALRTGTHMVPSTRFLLSLTHFFSLDNPARTGRRWRQSIDLCVCARIVEIYCALQQSVELWPDSRAPYTLLRKHNSPSCWSASISCAGLSCLLRAQHSHEMPKKGKTYGHSDCVVPPSKSTDDFLTFKLNVPRADDCEFSCHLNKWQPVPVRCVSDAVGAYIKSPWIDFAYQLKS